jgi:trigger factor
MIGSSYQAAITQEKLRPAVQPAIQTTGTPTNGEIEYTATFEVMPEIGKIDISGLEISKPTSSVTDSDIDTMIETLRMQRRTFQPVERTVQAGDMVLFEYAAEAGGARHPATGYDRVGTLVGSGAFLAEVESALVGHTAGDDFTVDATFPAAFREPLIAGKTAKVEVKVVRVQEPHMPDVDEAFAASFGIKDGGLSKFREDVRANLERELRGVLMGRLKAITAEKLVDAYPEIDLPQAMIENDARQLARQSNAQGDDAFVQFLPAARRRVAAGFLLAELGRQNEVRLDSRRVSEALASIASTYEEPEKVVELYTRDPQLMQGLQSRVMEDQVVEWVAEHAKLTEQPLSFTEVMRPGV